MTDDDLIFLSDVLDFVGGTTKLAEALGVGTSVVANWTYRQTVPRPWALVLRLKYADVVRRVVAQS